MTVTRKIKCAGVTSARRAGLTIYGSETAIPNSSSETQGQIKGARESLNGRKNMTRRKVKNGEKSSSRRSLLFFVSYFSARLDFPSSPLSAPGSPRMFQTTNNSFDQGNGCEHTVKVSRSFSRLGFN